jgi:hypothetical protein
MDKIEWREMTMVMDKTVQKDEDTKSDEKKDDIVREMKENIVISLPPN